MFTTARLSPFGEVVVGQGVGVEFLPTLNPVIELGTEGEPLDAPLLCEDHGASLGAQPDESDCSSLKADLVLLGEHSNDVEIGPADIDMLLPEPLRHQELRRKSIGFTLDPLIVVLLNRSLLKKLKLIVVSVKGEVAELVSHGPPTTTLKSHGCANRDDRPISKSREPPDSTDHGHVADERPHLIGERFNGSFCRALDGQLVEGLSGCGLGPLNVGIVPPRSLTSQRHDESAPRSRQAASAARRHWPPRNCGNWHATLGNRSGRCRAAAEARDHSDSRGGAPG